MIRSKMKETNLNEYWTVSFQNDSFFHVCCEITINHFYSKYLVNFFVKKKIYNVIKKIIKKNSQKITDIFHASFIYRGSNRNR